MSSETVPAMASTKADQKVRKHLEDQNVKTIVLTGEAGVGKTWIAKEMSDFASSKGLSYMTFWVFLNERDESKSLYQGRSLLENIARQLSVLSAFEEWEDNIVSKEEERPKEESLESLKEKISAKLGSMRSSATPADVHEKKKFLLLILDGVPDKMNEDAILPEIKNALQLTDEIPYKVLITRRKELERPPAVMEAIQQSKEKEVKEGEASQSKENEVKEVKEGEASQSKEQEGKEVTKETESKGMKKEIEIEPLSDKERLTLLEETVTEKVKNNAGFKKWEKEIAEKSKGLPAAIVVIAEAFNRIGSDVHDDSTLELGGAPLPDDPGINPLLLSAYDMLPRSDKALINCWWHSFDLFLKHGGVHYHELIAFWILEGYVGAFDRVEEAYKEGHRVMMELVDRHLLKMQDDNILVMEGLALTPLLHPDHEEGHRVLMELVDRHLLKKQDDNILVMEGLALTPLLPDHHSRRADGFESGAANLGLATVLEGGDWQGFRRITQVGGMIKTPSTGTDQKWKDKLVSTLLIDGRRLYREVPDDFFKPMQGLRVLVLFNPTFKELPQSLSQMRELRLLVLRGCDPLEKIEPIRELESLIVLEISGAASLKNISDAEFFKKLRKLRSLNLSAAQIKSLPSSISDLTELRWLILSGCSSLQSLPKITNFTNLEVLDLSGATELKTLEGRAWKLLKKLRMLDVSKTMISRLPILGDLENLATISLSGCEDLARLPKLKGLSKLQVLDLSGAKKLKEFPEDSLHPSSVLKILRLSQTLITNLPSNFNRLSKLESLDLSGAHNLVKLEDNTFEKLSDRIRHLDLSNTKIENLPSLLLSKLGSLEVLVLSGCSALTKIGDDLSFEKMTRLERLNLSGSSKIESLPSLSELVNLRQLLLRNCTGLKLLPSFLESLLKLVNLRQLDLNGCSAKFPEGAKADFLIHMNDLQLLNLSGTGLILPPLSNLTNLTNLAQLSIRGCSESEPNLGNHTKLEVLDLSEITKITSLPSLGELSSLRELKLRGCSGLKQLPDLKSQIHLEVLDLWGTEIKEFPYAIFELTSLKHVDLPDMKGIQKLEWERIERLPEEVNWVECGILKHCRNGPCISLNPTQLSKLLNKDNPDQLRDLGNVHIFVSPPLEEEQRSGGDIFWHRVDPSLRKIYLMNFSVPEEHGLFLEIVGFDSFPEGIKGAIVQAKYVSLIGNKFIKSLSDLAAVNEGATAMKGCMVEKCTEMETIFGGEEREVKMRENLETLKASNLPKLKSVVFIGNEKLVGGFQNLRELYLDCCPVLEVVFRSSQQPENLEILQIKFCDKLKTMFSSEAPTDCKLQKLRKLHLLELPELTSIGVPESKKVSDIFPSLKLIKYRNCPKMINYLREYREYPGLAIEEY